MVKVIKSGPKTFFGICSKCGCQFSYELSDLWGLPPAFVRCPECDEKFFHPRQNTNTDPLCNPLTFDIQDYGTTCSASSYIDSENN